MMHVGGDIAQIGPSARQAFVPHTITPHQPVLLTQGKICACLHAVHANFWPYHLHATRFIRTQNVFYDI